jgi:hypothetical protein
MRACPMRRGPRPPHTPLFRPCTACPLFILVPTNMLSSAGTGMQIPSSQASYVGRGHAHGQQRPSRIHPQSTHSRVAVFAIVAPPPSLALIVHLSPLSLHPSPSLPVDIPLPLQISLVAPPSYMHRSSIHPSPTLSLRASSLHSASPYQHARC